MMLAKTSLFYIVLYCPDFCQSLREDVQHFTIKGPAYCTNCLLVFPLAIDFAPGYAAILIAGMAEEML
jgi:hypothetical protein